MHWKVFCNPREPIFLGDASSQLQLDLATYDSIKPSLARRNGIKSQQSKSASSSSSVINIFDKKSNSLTSLGSLDELPPEYNELVLKISDKRPGSEIVIVEVDSKR